MLSIMFEIKSNFEESHPTPPGAFNEDEAGCENQGCVDDDCRSDETEKKARTSTEGDRSSCSTNVKRRPSMASTKNIKTTTNPMFYPADLPCIPHEYRRIDQKHGLVQEFDNYSSPSLSRPPERHRERCVAFSSVPPKTFTRWLRCARDDACRCSPQGFPAVYSYP